MLYVNHLMVSSISSLFTTVNLSTPYKQELMAFPAEVTQAGYIYQVIWVAGYQNQVEQSRIWIHRFRHLCRTGWCQCASFLSKTPLQDWLMSVRVISFKTSSLVTCCELAKLFTWFGTARFHHADCSLFYVCFQHSIMITSVKKNYRRVGIKFIYL